MKKFKFFLALMAGLALLGITNSAFADDNTNVVTITGNMVCGKCTLHITKSCQNVVQVTENGQTVNYFLKQNDISKGVHDDVCGGSSEKVTVTGTVDEEDGKKIMTATKIDVIKS